MGKRPTLVALDQEGVITPEVWIAVARSTGIEELRLTTRDIPDYDVLMRKRLGILRQHGIRLADIQKVIRGMDLLPGAKDFLDRLRATYPTVVLSDTYYEFAAHFVAKLGWPVLFCNTLEVDSDGMIAGYRLRIHDGKRHAVLAFKQLNFHVVAIGDSYNDTSMLAEADLGILFRPSENVKREFPQFPVATEYSMVAELIERDAGT